MDSDTTGDRVLNAISDRRELINEALDEDVPSRSPERLYEATRYLLKAGGKRLRPTVALLTAESLADISTHELNYRSFPALDGSEIDVMSAATAIEVIQSFTLIHDDIMDEDDLRRGVPAVHQQYDTEILAGDTLYAKAFELMSSTGADPANGTKAVHRLATTCTKICEGQALDVEFERQQEVLPVEYLEMVELKTAVLYGAAAATTAMLMDASDKTIQAMYRYGIDAGCAFQIQDDVLDLTVPSEELGKQRGSDLVENKETLITLHARKHGTDVDALVPDTRVSEVSEEDIDAAVESLRSTGSITYASEKATELVENAKGHLTVLPDNKPRSLLADIADFFITRRY